MAFICLLFPRKKELQGIESEASAIRIGRVRVWFSASIG